MRLKHKFMALAAVGALSLSAIAPVASMASATRAAKPNIVQTAVAAGQFKTLVKLVKQAGLAGALQGKGPFTVFAPTDAAFAKVPKATLAALAKDKAKLRAVLLYHVAKGKLTAAKVVKMRSIKTLNGQSLKVRVNHGTVTVGGARVVKADIGASNGVIHVINQVLIPR
ncbi:MAG TPA: fasciclin domain-containing protein [Solirubrobacteraceae bacterium]|nr:fasciclin domain-containing protein [Solirubrobacteraceae bacterium]